MNKKIRTLFITAASALSFAAVTLGNLQGAYSHENISAFASDDEFAELSTQWFTLDAEASSATDTDPGVAKLSLQLSPILSDYQSFGTDSIKQFLNKDTGLIGAVKYILSKQVQFIKKVEPDENRATDPITSNYDTTNRNAIFEQFVKAAFGLGSDNKPEDEEEFIDEYEKYLEIMSYTYAEVESEIDDGKVPTGGNFLRSVLAYLAGKQAQDESFEEDDIGVLLGVDGDNVNTNSGLGNALKLIYQNDESVEDSTEQVKNDIKQIYSDACAIANGTKPQSLALAEVFVLLQETKVPLPVVVEILGKDTVKQAIIDCFEDPDGVIPSSVVHNMLETFTKDTIYGLCCEIGFTKAELKQAITNMGNERLLEIAKDMSEQGYDNVRIILGMAVEEGATKSLKSISRATDHFYTFSGEFAKFGSELVNVVLGRMTLLDMVNAAEAIWIRNVDEAQEKEHLLYSYNYNSPNEGRRLYTRNLISWLKEDLPTLAEIATKPDGQHTKTYHIEVMTPLNQQRVWVDFTIGFQNKDTSAIRNIAKILDDAFDLTYDFVEGENQDYSKNTLKYNLVARPQYLTNIYDYLCSSGFINNTENNRLKERLFNIAFMKFGEMKNYFAQDLVNQMIADLGNLDYETALNTLLTLEKFKEVFKNSGATQEDINRFVQNINILAEKFDSISGDMIVDLLKSVAGNSIGEKFDKDEFKDFIDDLAALGQEIKEQEISVEMLKELQNETIYAYVETLVNKQDTLKRINKGLYNFANAIPTEFDNKSIMDFYVGNGQFKFDDLYKLDWERILGVIPLGSKFATFFDMMVAPEDKLQYADGEINADINVNLNAESNKIFAITYKYTEGGNTLERKGMLPTGSKIADFGPDYIDGKEVYAWKRDDNGLKIANMISEDLVVNPIFYQYVDFSSAEWDYTSPFAYDETSHSVGLKDSTLPDGLGTLYEIAYSNNVETEDGSYIAVVTITPLQENVIIINYPSELSWTILPDARPTYYSFVSGTEDAFGNPLSSFTLDIGTKKIPVLNIVENINAFDNKDVNYDELLGVRGELYDAYDLSLTLDNVVIDGSGTITILIPEELRGSDEFKIITINEAGEVIEVSYQVSEDGLYATFHVNKLTSIGFVGPAGNDISLKANWMVLLFVLLGVSNIMLVIVFVFKKRKDDDDDKVKPRKNNEAKN